MRKFPLLWPRLNIELACAVQLSMFCSVSWTLLCFSVRHCCSSRASRVLSDLPVQSCCLRYCSHVLQVSLQCRRSCRLRERNIVSSTWWWVLTINLLIRSPLLVGFIAHCCSVTESLHWQRQTSYTTHYHHQNQHHSMPITGLRVRPHIMTKYRCRRQSVLSCYIDSGLNRGMLLLACC